jgi:hypothetical protein
MRFSPGVNPQQVTSRHGNCGPGTALPDAPGKLFTTLQQCDSTRIFLSGLCGEIGRAYYWKEAAIAGSASPELLVRRLKLPQHNLFIEAAQSWLQTVPLSRLPDILDLMYIEQRLGCWAGPSHYGHAGNVRNVPLSDRRIIEAMLQLPATYRCTGQVAADVIRVLWPDLLSVPFNQDSPGVRLWRAGKRLLPGRWVN